MKTSGRAAERADWAKETLQAAADREGIHLDVSKRPDADVRDLSLWVHYNG
ncbi:hypothetical protein [Rhizobium ruizarguesonis]|uniref:hypothetical protein n=1 Tax=Rhizobium ruizarguesonis TaxID=2081791 RepID=UPI0013EE519F|nr:hypothetical protein [Rhizobium ruizarguesonis]